MDHLRRFIPSTRKEMKARGWDSLDILLVSGDAHVDHPSFGVVLIGRLLMAEGYRVGLIAQPLCPGLRRPRLHDWFKRESQHSENAGSIESTEPSSKIVSEKEALEDFSRLGRPRLFAGIGAGVTDSMTNNYTANRKKRSDDMYSPGNEGGLRPDYATSVYAHLIKKAFPNLPIVAGGIEASLRRLAHYDYWKNRVLPSLIMDDAIDLLVYGMGETQILRIARELSRNPLMSREELISAAGNERGLAYITSMTHARSIEPRLTIPSFEEVLEDKRKFMKAACFIEGETNPWNAKTVVQYHGENAVVVTPPPQPLDSKELDRFYNLPFSKEPHYSYLEAAKHFCRKNGMQEIEAIRLSRITAYEMIKNSITINRGCYGGCTFCGLTLHQGRKCRSRAESSILSEIRNLAAKPWFKGIISDMGGPTANMYGTHEKNADLCLKCRKPSCLHPVACHNLSTSHTALTRLLKESVKINGIRKTLIASGVRFDLALSAPDGMEYLRELVSHHVGGHLKIAPEHADPDILRLMRKPQFEVFEKFLAIFEELSRKYAKEQYLVPYFISGFPGCDTKKMAVVTDWLAKKNWKLQQVQAFIPLPMTIASAMYWCQLDPITGKPLNVPKDRKSRFIQQNMLQPKRKRYPYKRKR
ncbi:MAG: YgiQ family radical SAM protein [Oligoflexales bacterium]|nr:YgiQ family radical SAM protein [Oligoflexales bacterium]